MSSSRNRHAPLEKPFSSKEQEPRGSSTCITNQTMSDTAQPSLSAGSELMTISGLGGGIPQTLSREEVRAHFYKWGAIFDEEDRKEKLRQSKSSTFKGNPTWSTAPSNGLRKRKGSPDEAEKSSKRPRTEPLYPSQATEDPTTPALATASEEKSSTAALVIQEDRVSSPPSSFQWADIRNPSTPLLCIIQVNNLSRKGSFAEESREWAFQLTLDAGRWRSPTMTMRFFPEGVQEPSCAQTGWRLGDYHEDEWMVLDFKVHRVADYAEDGEICPRDILAACNTHGEKARLVCISLEAWPKVIGEFKRCVKRLFSAMFTARHPYRLRIWFLAPFNVDKFNSQCLSFFTRYFKHRESLHTHRDANGVSFEEHLKSQESQFYSSTNLSVAVA